MRGHVYFFTHLDLPYTVAASLLDGDPSRWLPRPAEPRGDLWVVDLCADGALPGPVSEHAAEVAVGAAEHSEEQLTRTVSWRSAQLPSLIPMLAADLEMAPLHGSGCRLALVGSYRPPLSVVGSVADRLHGHRVAEACARRFVLDVGDRLAASTLHA
jgi:hypothetical protein